MTEFDLLLADRLGVIRDFVSKYGEDNIHISFSGGKDSTALHYLFDIALPNNKIPRVYVDTGIEYLAIRSFVQSFVDFDPRFVVLKPTKPIRQVLEQYGYPFKSKEHSLRVYQFNRGHNGNYLKKYCRKTDYNGKFICPKCLLYQFDERGKYNFSNLCCYKMKKEPFKSYEKLTGRHICVTGMRAEEGGNRARLGCIIRDSKGNVVHFHPLIKVDETFINLLSEKYGFKYASLYYPPFNFRRTGCKGCPFALDLQEQLTIMEVYMPNERKQCEFIWKYVYDEYRRIGYRLDKEEQLRLF